MEISYIFRCGLALKVNEFIESTLKQICQGYVKMWMTYADIFTINEL